LEKAEYFQFIGFDLFFAAMTIIPNFIVFTGFFPDYQPSHGQHQRKLFFGWKQ